MRTIRARLTGWRELAPNVRHFEFETPKAAGFMFTPGQFIWTAGYEQGKEIARAYSIASPRIENRFALCVSRDCTEATTPYLFTLRSGDELDISEPLGSFTLRDPKRPLVFVATGTGIAPFRSMLLDLLPAAQPPVALLFGAREERGLFYREEFEMLAKRYEAFRFLPTVTRPSEQWQGRTGRVQSYLEEALEQRDADVYLCGRPEMVEEVKAILQQRGFAPEQIIYESYP